MYECTYFVPLVVCSAAESSDTKPRKKIPFFLQSHYAADTYSEPTALHPFSGTNEITFKKRMTLDIREYFLPFGGWGAVSIAGSFLSEASVIDGECPGCGTTFSKPCFIHSITLTKQTQSLKRQKVQTNAL